MGFETYLTTQAAIDSVRDGSVRWEDALAAAQARVSAETGCGPRYLVSTDRQDGLDQTLALVAGLDIAAILGLPEGDQGHHHPTRAQVADSLVLAQEAAAAAAVWDGVGVTTIRLPAGMTPGDVPAGAVDARQALIGYREALLTRPGNGDGLTGATPAQGREASAAIGLSGGTIFHEPLLSLATVPGVAANGAWAVHLIHERLDAESIRSAAHEVVTFCREMAGLLDPVILWNSWPDGSHAPDLSFP